MPFDIRLLKTVETIEGLEVHGRLILATALLTGSPLVTKNKEIHARKIKAIW